jgi:hypothetical protein
MKIGGGRKGRKSSIRLACCSKSLFPPAALVTTDATIGGCLSSAANCFWKGTRSYQRAASRPGPNPFFNSQTRKAASSNLLVRPSVSTGARTMSSSSSITMREACPTGRRDSAAENSVFRSFEVLFLFTIAVIHYGKLELFVLPDLFGRICTRLFFSKQFTASSNKEKT